MMAGVRSVLGVLRAGRVTTPEDRILLRCPPNLHPLWPRSRTGR